LVEKTYADLVRREQEFEREEKRLNALYKELVEFQRRYQRILSPRKAVLDRVRAQVAEAQQLLRAASLSPTPEIAGRRERRKAAEERRLDPDAEPITVGLNSPDALKRLYREIVRQVHPDHATCESDRTLRHQYMIEVNRAYAAHDLEWLQNILRELRRRVDLSPRDGHAARYQLLIRKLDDVEGKLSAVVAELESLSQTELYRVYVRAEQARAEGRNLLEEIALDLDDEIDQTKARGYDILLKLYRHLDAGVRY
jgi:hypothetical protein